MTAMTMLMSLFAAAAILMSVAIGSAKAEGNAKRGAAVYRACAACHSLEPGLHLTGPSLAGLWERRAASIEDFPRYSKALKAREVVWDEVTLNAWIAQPDAFVKGTSMTFRGIDDDKARGDLVAFLRLAMAPDGMRAVVAKGLIPEQLARGQTPEPLSKAGSDERVTSVTHCRNTFHVRTEDGAEHLFWELNLRLKVDSGATGPKGGRPVLVGSGMQRDRASLVFSEATQIGTFIQKC